MPPKKNCKAKGRQGSAAQVQKQRCLTNCKKATRNRQAECFQGLGNNGNRSASRPFGAGSRGGEKNGGEEGRNGGKNGGQNGEQSDDKNREGNQEEEQRDPCPSTDANAK